MGSWTEATWGSRLLTSRVMEAAPSQLVACSMGSCGGEAR